MKRLTLLCLLLIGAAAGPARASTTVYGPHASNATQTNVAAPAGTTSTTGLMMGLAGAITPAHSGNVLLIVSGTLTNGTTSDGASLQIRYGTGAAPNFEKKYHILTLREPLPDVAKKMKMSKEEFYKRLEQLKHTMFDVRAQRDKPFLNKIALTA